MMGVSSRSSDSPIRTRSCEGYVLLAEVVPRMARHLLVASPRHPFRYNSLLFQCHRGVRLAKHMPKGRGYRVVRPNGQQFVATLIKWVRMNDRSSIAMFKVRNPKKKTSKR